MQHFYLSFILAILASPVMAQINFQLYQTPVLGDDNYRLVVDYSSDNQVFFPIETADTLYIHSAANGFVAKDFGLYITAFYANNGDLYLVENTTPAGFTPKLLKSTDNGNNFTEITGTSGRLFQRNHFGHLFYSVPGGFAYSTDDGANFTTLQVPDSVFSATRSATGDLYYMTDTSKLYKSTDNGATWQNISKQGSFYNAYERYLDIVNDTIYFQCQSGAYYATDTDTTWRGLYYVSASSLVTGLHISPDETYFAYGPYGFATTNTPYDQNSWTNSSFYVGTPQSHIYNHFIAIADSIMYTYYPDSGYVYASRVPNLVGIDETVGLQQIVSVYPNPTNGQISVNLNTVAQQQELVLYNLQGQKVFTKTLSALQQTFTLSSLPPGIYIWQVADQRGRLMVH